MSSIVPQRPYKQWWESEWERCLGSPIPNVDNTYWDNCLIFTSVEYLFTECIQWSAHSNVQHLQIGSGGSGQLLSWDLCEVSHYKSISFVILKSSNTINQKRAHPMSSETSSSFNLFAFTNRPRTRCLTSALALRDSYRITFSYLKSGR